MIEPSYLLVYSKNVLSRIKDMNHSSNTALMEIPYQCEC